MKIWTRWRVPAFGKKVQGDDMGYRRYGEPEEKESPVSAFFMGLFLGILLYDGGLWVFVSFGWISQLYLRLICLSIGVLIGARMAYGSWRRLQNQKNQERKE